MRWILWVMTALVPSAVWAGEVFEVRGWDLERPEPAYVEAMIARAEQAGMNTISLSHEIVMNAEEILHDWHRDKKLRHYCTLAGEHGMKVYLWNHQINNPPQQLIRVDEQGYRILDFDHPQLWAWLHDRYQRVVDRVPQLDGIILSLTESEWQIHRDPSEPAWYAICRHRVESRLSPAERMAKVINTVRDSLHARGKRLIVRDFLRSPAEMKAFAEALEAVPDDVWVMSKCVPNDWQYRYPPHPLLGKVGPHKQVMELDLYNETGGALNMAMPAPAYYQKQIRMARDLGLAGVIPRLDDGWHSNRGTPSEFNIFVYNRLIHDPDADIAPMWEEFYVPMYGEKAAPAAIACLKKCFDLVCSLQFTLGFWTGGPGAAVDYTDSHLQLHSSALWSDDPKYKEIETLLRESGREAIRRTMAEKREAEFLAHKCLARLDESRGGFEPAQFIALRGTFEEALQHARIGQLWARAYWALRWYRNTKTPDARGELVAAIEACEAFCAAEHGPVTPYVASLPERRQERFFTGRLPQFVEEVRAAMAGVEEME